MRTLTICNQDIARYTIVLSPTPAPAEQTAATFLRRVIETACGVTLPISDTAKDCGIYIGSRGASDEVKLDGFRITTDDKNVYLDGNIPRGTLYAAFDFAETYLGYRMFALDCEVIPTDGAAEVPLGLDHIDNPVFEVRRLSSNDWHTNGVLAAHARVNANVRADMEPYGGVRFQSIDCHTYQNYLSHEEYGESHPEYFALVNGVRSNVKDGQLCLTNPDVLRIVTENVLTELRADPTITLVDFSQMDFSLGCTCEHCAAVDAEEESQAGSMIRFVNALAEAVEKEFPHVMIQTFAYEYTTKPPKLTVARENVIVRYCTYSACFRHPINDPDCHTNGNIHEEIEGWRRMSHHISLWDYIVNWNCFIAPFPNLISLRENMRYFADCNVCHYYASSKVGIGTEGAYTELKSYLIGKLMWNPYMSDEEYERHILEFLQGYYGKGWEAIRRYIALEHETTADRCVTCQQSIDLCFAHYDTYPKMPTFKRFFRRSYTAKPYQPMLPDHPLTKLCECLDEAGACFDQALTLAETERERFRSEKSRFALTYLDLFCTEHDEFQMTAEEKAVYEAACERFYEDKKRFGAYYNNHTINRGN